MGQLFSQEVWYGGNDPLVSETTDVEATPEQGSVGA